MNTPLTITQSIQYLKNQPTQIHLKVESESQSTKKARPLCSKESLVLKIVFVGSQFNGKAVDVKVTKNKEFSVLEKILALEKFNPSLSETDFNNLSFFSCLNGIWLIGDLLHNYRYSNNEIINVKIRPQNETLKIRIGVVVEDSSDNNSKLMKVYQISINPSTTVSGAIILLEQDMSSNFERPSNCEMGLFSPMLNAWLNKNSPLFEFGIGNQSYLEYTDLGGNEEKTMKQMFKDKSNGVIQTIQVKNTKSSEIVTMKINSSNIISTIVKQLFEQIKPSGYPNQFGLFFEGNNQERYYLEEDKSFGRLQIPVETILIFMEKPDVILSVYQPGECFHTATTASNTVKPKPETEENNESLSCRPRAFSNDKPKPSDKIPKKSPTVKGKIVNNNSANTKSKPKYKSDKRPKRKDKVDNLNIPNKNALLLRIKIPAYQISSTKFLLLSSTSDDIKNRIISSFGLTGDFTNYHVYLPTVDKGTWMRLGTLRQYKEDLKPGDEIHLLEKTKRVRIQESL